MSTANPANIARPSSRKPTDLRPVTISRAFTKHAEGSVLIAFGDTKVLCTAIPRQRGRFGYAVSICLRVRIVADGNLHSKRDAARVLEYGDRLLGTFKVRHAMNTNTG